MAIQVYYNAADENQSDPIKVYQLENPIILHTNFFVD